MMGQGDFRDPIAQMLALRQQQQQRRPQQQPFAQAQPMQPMQPMQQMQQLSRPTQPAPVMGTPQPRPQEQNPYGFQSGFNAVRQPSDDTRKDSGWKDLYDNLTQGFGPRGSEWT